MVYKILRLLILFIAVPVTAQNHFVTIDWSLLGEIHTLPEMVEEIPLPDDFRSYSYQVDIEFPEFEDLDETTSAKVRATGEVLPDYPHTTTEISISAHKGFLNVRFIPVVYRNGR